MSAQWCQVILREFDLELRALCIDIAVLLVLVDERNHAHIPAHLVIVSRDAEFDLGADGQHREPILDHGIGRADVIDMQRMPFVPFRFPAIEVDEHIVSLSVDDAAGAPDAVPVSHIAFCKSGREPIAIEVRNHHVPAVVPDP